MLEYESTLDQQISAQVSTQVSAQVSAQVSERTQSLEARNQLLAQAQKQAEAVSQAKSEFLARMSHELRTPLSSILGFSEIMRNDPALDAQYRDNLNVISESGEHLLSIVNEVLDLSKIEANQLTLNNQAVNLTALVASLEAMFRLQAQQKRLVLRCSVDNQLPQYICVDEKKLRQYLINLLGNALKFTHSGHVILRVWPDNVLEPLPIPSRNAPHLPTPLPTPPLPHPIPQIHSKSKIPALASRPRISNVFLNRLPGYGGCNQR
ncbi:MAG: hypothetical protein HC857_13975 [Synechococcales cyanobacterium RU_4_20]|nr:hypothetical protein [Synechococcales cyanobacterium RU_4_20]